MAIDLNEEKYDGGGDVSIFNNGKAGIAEDVTISIVKKTPEDKEKSPDIKVEFSDSTGATMNMPFWTVTGPNDWNSEEELIAKQAKVLKHLAHAVLGKDFKFPTFDNATQMLNGVMKAISKALKGSKLKFRVFANYGSTRSPKQYIQPRSWVPFIEPMSVDLEETRLKPGNIDAMERVTADDDAAPTTGSMDNGSADDEDDW